MSAQCEATGIFDKFIVNPEIFVEGISYVEPQRPGIPRLGLPGLPVFSKDPTNRAKNKLS
jgi:hypothetical protein